LSCRRRSAGHQSRHHAVNYVFARTLKSIGIPAVLEPPGLIRDGKRPNGSTLVPWSGGRSMIWDFTCPVMLAPSMFTVGAAASSADF